MRDLDVVLVLTVFTAVAFWLTVHDPKRRDLRDLNRNDKQRRRLR